MKMVHAFMCWLGPRTAESLIKAFGYPRLHDSERGPYLDNASCSFVALSNDLISASRFKA
jgi:hypothetical protein